MSLDKGMSGADLENLGRVVDRWGIGSGSGRIPRPSGFSQQLRSGFVERGIDPTKLDICPYTGRGCDKSMGLGVFSEMCNGTYSVCEIYQVRQVGEVA